MTRASGDPFATGTDEERLAADGIDVRRLAAAEAEPFLDWVRHWGGTWHVEAARAGAEDPVRVHVAVRDGKYIGFACHGVNRRSWFGPMGTDESARGSGIGGVLLRRCLADMRDAGIDVAEIAWVGPYRFYSRTVGATITRSFWIYEKAA